NVVPDVALVLNHELVHVDAARLAVRFRRHAHCFGVLNAPARHRTGRAQKGRDMRKHIHVAAVLLGMTFVVMGAPAGAQTQAKSSIEEIRKELMQMPYYGVFDFIAFTYNKGTVTLGGYAYHPTLKADAERAVKR